MSLPKIKQPIYSHTLYSTKKDIKYRPFTNKEQKILLLAKESENESEIYDAIMQIIELTTFGKIDPSTLPSFDLELLLIKIRSKSVGDVVEPTYNFTYKNDDGEELTEQKTLKINLNDIKLTIDDKHTNKLMVTDEVGIIMKYPTLKSIKSVSNESDFIIAHIESVFDSENLTMLNDCTQEEINEFYESLDMNAMLKIDNFFKTMPNLSYKVDVTLKNGTIKTVTFDNINDFFI